MSALSTIVAKFRKTSPNIAAAFDEVERRLVLLEQPATPPPPVVQTPWPDYRYEVSLTQTSLPNRHTVYNPDGTLTLTVFSDTPKLGTDRQLAAAYLPGGAALAAEGRTVRYETTVRFEPGFQWTTGQLNWLMEWHTNTGAGAGKLSNAIGVATDYPVVMGQAGKNPRWMFRPTGPNGDRYTFGPPVEAGRAYRLRVDILWSTGSGRFRVWLDDTLACDQSLATLYSGDAPSFGLYNYRLASPWTATVTFTRPTMVVVS